ncbi:MAG: hypothetical protein Alpg2KO_02730 [Alphaproteobacteria bacterium]
MTTPETNQTEKQLWQRIVEDHQQATRRAVQAVAHGDTAHDVIALEHEAATQLASPETEFGIAGASLARVDGVSPKTEPAMTLATTHMMQLYLPLAELAGRAALIKYNPLIEKAYWWFVAIIFVFFGWTIFKSGISFEGIGWSTIMFAAGTVFGIGIGHFLHKRRARQMAEAVRQVGRDFGIDLDPVADKPEKLAGLLKPLTFELTRLGDQSFRLPMQDLREHVAKINAQHASLVG